MTDKLKILFLCTAIHVEAKWLRVGRGTLKAIL